MNEIVIIQHSTDMPPLRDDESTGVLDENDLLETTGIIQTVGKKPGKNFKRVFVWRNIIIFSTLHIASVYGIYLGIYKARWLTLLWNFGLLHVAGFGITAGAHRLWSHRSYKAKLPLRIILMIMNCMALQNSIHEWARDHRVHHKYSETNADPHNANRGFFFAHMGWLLERKHPDVIAKGKGIDVSDLESDNVVMFQKKYYLILAIFWCFIFPPIIPIYFFGESWTNAIFICSLFRYCSGLHFTWLVNSLAHLHGNKPYDKYINPSENLFVSIYSLGEGFHNYHHVFPWDYKTSELGDYWNNYSTGFIDFFAKFGLAYDMKQVNPEAIKKRVERTGDGTHGPWGWGDRDIPKEDIDSTEITN